MKQKIKKYLDKLPYLRSLVLENNRLKDNSKYPPGHFYSPIPLVKELEKKQDIIWENKLKEGINGIELNTKNQLELLNQLSKYYEELPFKANSQDGVRYKFDNGLYSYTDGIILYCLIRHLKPKRIIEIGSGHSSAVMLDTNELFFKNKIQLTFIEPFPDRLISLLTKEDKKNINLIKSEVQSVSLDNFKKLEAGDILFVDSSHVVKTASDVNFILFDVLPILQSGVFIHFHDIFYPFEYPKKWVLSGINWNEDYFLKAFLMYNNKFEIRLFSEYLHRFHDKAFKKMPLSYNNIGGNLWIEKK